MRSTYLNFLAVGEFAIVDLDYHRHNPLQYFIIGARVGGNREQQLLQREHSRFATVMNVL